MMCRKNRLHKKDKKNITLLPVTLALALVRTISTSSLSDSELVSLYQKSKDLSVLSDLFQRYLAMCFAVCMKYLKDNERSKDAVMDVFEQLPKKLTKHDIGNFKSWLYVVVKNHCLMQLRSSANGKVIALDESYMQSVEPLHHDTGNSERDWAVAQLEDCMQNLATTQKQCVTLFYLENKCYKDISAVTGWDFNKVRSLIQNGKRNLKICMEEKRNKAVKNE